MIYKADLESLGFTPKDIKSYSDTDTSKPQGKGMEVYPKSPLQMVKEYQITSGQEADPYLYYKLIDEELSEWCFSYTVGEEAEELKELADVVYVIFGYANAMGWNLDEALKRVHENNMQRMTQDDGTIKRSLSGKIIKNPNTPKPDLNDLV